MLACGATLLALLTFVTPLTTQARTAADLGAGPSAQSWLLSAMSLGLAVALLPAGALADDAGRRRVFVAGLGVLAVGAAVCTSAWTPLVFIAGRLLQGVGGGAVLACALGLIGHAFAPGPLRAHATGVWGASVGGGIGAAGALAVLVDQGSSWRGSYAVTAVAAVVVGAIAARLLVESRAAHPRPPDLVGAGLLGAGLASLLAGLVQARQGWTEPLVLDLGGVAAVLLVAFVVAEARVAAPMLDLGLFRRPQFVGATVGALTNGAGAIALASLLPTLIQQGLGDSLLMATGLTALFPGTSVFTALNVKHLPVSGPTMLVVGLVGIGVGQLLMVGLTPGSAAVRLVPGLVLSGVCFGMVNAALGREAVAAVPPDRTSMESGANNTARYVGSAVGVSIAVVIFTRGVGAGGTSALIPGWNAAATITAATSIVGGALVLACQLSAAVRRR